MKNLINGEWRSGVSQVPNINPNTGEVVSQSEIASAKDIEDAAEAASRAFEVTRKRASFEREQILLKVAKLLEEAQEEIVSLMTIELGRPVKFNRAEVQRGIFTLRDGAEEAKRLRGEYLPLDLSERTRNHESYWKRVPVGPVIAITPFNFPVNLLLHKIVPAIACGCPVTIKVPPQTPDTPRKICELFMQAGCVKGEINCFDAAPETAQSAVEDDRYKLFTFTGSPAVGWKLKAVAGKKRVLLELGNSSAAAVHHDVQDIPGIAQRLCNAAFAATGQVCISLQRLFVHRSRYAEFKDAFLEAVDAMPWGDPKDPEAVMAAMIDDPSAERVERWIADAVKGGATCLSGGTREGRVIEPTVMEGVDRGASLVCEEVFGPVVNLFPYETMPELIEAVNATPFGLQASIFTDSIQASHAFIEGADVAAVMVNETPVFRIDHMPYGGIKDSGLGREGTRFALEEYTERKLVVHHLGEIG